MTGTAEGFVVILLPDTQCYSSGGALYDPGACGAPPNGNISMLSAQMNWIVANRDLYKIVAVIGLGDIVENGGKDNEWQAADSAYQVLDKAQIPYVAAIGNHDYDTGTTNISRRLTIKYNQYFGLARLAQHPWLGTSSYPVGSADNSYATFEVGADKYLVLSLEFFPRNAAVQWAAGVIGSNLDRQVILVTHSYVGADGSRSSNTCGTPQAYGLMDGNDGEAVWNSLAGKYSNVIAVVNGHCSSVSTKGPATAVRVDAGMGGNLVAQMLSNYQYIAGGGNGYLRLVNIQPTKQQIVVQTYSPYSNTWIADSANAFTLTYGIAK